MTELGGAATCFHDRGPLFPPESVDFLRFRREEINVSPNLNFSCTGNVTRWQAIMDRARIYTTIAFFVLRPTDQCIYEIVGRDVHSNVDVNSSLLVDVAASSMILVQPGDVIGVYADHNAFRRESFASYNNDNWLTYSIDISDNLMLTS